MRAFLIGLAVFLSACASETVVKDANRPHLPPPGFPVSEAPLGKTCGGMVRTEGSECGTGEYCHRTMSAQCGAADAPGVCRALPQACTREYNPVCGCDGQTYPTECTANAAGVSAAYAGECEAVTCTMQYDPVCGADGVTYGNACMAGRRPIAYAGECR